VLALGTLQAAHLNLHHLKGAGEAPVHAASSHQDGAAPATNYRHATDPAPAEHADCPICHFLRSSAAPLPELTAGWVRPPETPCLLPTPESRSLADLARLPWSARGPPAG
jgi:hypothetical protein